MVKKIKWKAFMQASKRNGCCGFFQEEIHHTPKQDTLIIRGDWSAKVENQAELKGRKEGRSRSKPQFSPVFSVPGSVAHSRCSGTSRHLDYNFQEASKAAQKIHDGWDQGVGKVCIQPQWNGRLCW